MPARPLYTIIGATPSLIQLCPMTRESMRHAGSLLDEQVVFATPDEIRELEERRAESAARPPTLVHIEAMLAYVAANKIEKWEIAQRGALVLQVRSEDMRRIYAGQTLDAFCGEAVAHQFGGWAVQSYVGAEANATSFHFAPAPGTDTGDF